MVTLARGRRLHHLRPWAGCALLVLAACRGRGGSERPSAAPPSATPKGRIVWAAQTNGSIESTPAVSSDGTIYSTGAVVVTEDDQGQPLPPGRARLAMVAVDRAGHLTRTVPGSLQSGFPPRKMWVRLAPSGTAYGVDDSGGLYVMAPDGSQSFHKTKDHFHSPPTITDNGRLYVDATRGMVVVEVPAGGEPFIVTKLDDEGGFGLQPALGPDGTIYLGTGSGVAAIDPFLQRRWHYRAAKASAAVVDEQGRIYLSDGRRLVALDVAGGERWVYPGDSLSIPAFSPEGVVVVGGGGLVDVVSHEGRRRWSFQLATQGWTAPTAGPDGTVYVTDRNALLTAIAPGGRPRWSAQLPAGGSSAGLGADGIAYVQGNDGTLRAVSGP